MTPSTPAQRAAGKIRPIRYGALGQTDIGWTNEVATIIEAEYATERKECVRVMKMVKAAMTDHNYLAAIDQLRELIGKMEG